MTVNIRVDGREIVVDRGRSLLEACLDNGIYIPNLCHLPAMTEPPASCRLCFVQIEGARAPVTSCTVEVAEGMVVQTDTPEVRRLQRSALRLLLSVHHVACKDCPAHKRCELQRLARFLKIGLKPKGLQRHLKEPAVDDSHPCLTYHPNRCVLCGKCIRVCRTAPGPPMMAFSRRGFDTTLYFDPGTQADCARCQDCRACVDICPVGALVLKAQTDTAAAPDRTA